MGRKDRAGIRVTKVSTAKQKYARKIRDAWTFCLSSHAQQSEWARLLSTINPKDFMLPQERRRFDNLPDEFTVYRGFQADSREGLSWSLSREVAEIFSRLNEKLSNGKVVKRRVRKSNVFALIVGDEMEIIILPRTKGSRKV